MTLFGLAGILAVVGLLATAGGFILAVTNMVALQGLDENFDEGFKTHAIAMILVALGGLSLLGGFISFCGYLAGVLT